MFHGDLHAGNVLIDEGDRFALVDFGICGRISAEQRAALVAFMLAFAQMDAAGLILGHFTAKYASEMAAFAGPVVPA